MRKQILFVALLLIGFAGDHCFGQTGATLRVILVRHGEKPKNGSNLTCEGLNRSLQLPEVLNKKFGKPDYLYIPSLSLGDSTKHARMFETAIPLAVRYQLEITSRFEEKDFSAIAANVKEKKGTVLMVWEHKAIKDIAAALGVTDPPKWADDDYDSIWIITFSNNKSPVLTFDKENIKPSDKCPL
jgi:hypothetical protein